MRDAIRGLSARDLRSCSASDMDEEEDDRDETLTLLSFAGGMAGTGAVPVVALVKLAMLQCPCSPTKKLTLFPSSLLFEKNRSQTLLKSTVEVGATLSIICLKGGRFTETSPEKMVRW